MKSVTALTSLVTLLGFAYYGCFHLSAPLAADLERTAAEELAAANIEGVTVEFEHFDGRVHGVTTPEQRRQVRVALSGKLAVGRLIFDDLPAAVTTQPREPAQVSVDTDFVSLYSQSLDEAKHIVSVDNNDPARDAHRSPKPLAAKTDLAFSDRTRQRRSSAVLRQPSQRGGLSTRLKPSLEGHVADNAPFPQNAMSSKDRSVAYNQSADASEFSTSSVTKVNYEQVAASEPVVAKPVPGEASTQGGGKSLPTAEPRPSLVPSGQPERQDTLVSAPQVPEALAIADSSPTQKPLEPKSRGEMMMEDVVANVRPRTIKKRTMEPTTPSVPLVAALSKDSARSEAIRSDFIESEFAGNESSISPASPRPPFDPVASNTSIPHESPQILNADLVSQSQATLPQQYEGTQTLSAPERSSRLQDPDVSSDLPSRIERVSTRAQFRGASEAGDSVRLVEQTVSEPSKVVQAEVVSAANDASPRQPPQTTEAPRNPRPKAQLGIYMTDHANDNVVRFVAVGSAAERSGLQKGDRIEKIDGVPIREFQDVVAIVAGRSAGDIIRVRLRRADQSLLLDVKLGGIKQP